MGELTFTTRLERRGPAAAVVLSDEQVEAIGEGPKRFPVAATINGHTWRGTVARMGGEFLLGMSKAVRDQVGAQAGDEVTVTIALDDAPREVEVPPALAAALNADPPVRAAFDALAYTHRKEFARWVAEAKQETTRDRRVAQAVTMIREGRTRS
jgi:hypothetical protein